MVPLEIKNSGSVKILKTKIRNWDPKDVTVTYLRPM